MKKNNIVENYQKKFKLLNEYSFYTPTLDEAGEEEMSQSSEEGVPQPAPEAQQGDGAPMSQLPQDSQVPPQEPQLDNSMPPMEGGETKIEDIEIDNSSDDNVEEIEITDLVDAQEQTHNEVQQLDVKFQQFSDFAEKLTQKLDAMINKSEETEKQIQNLGQEIVKRNPTDVETLNLRSLQSAPFSEKIDDYWGKKAQENPNYNIVSHNKDNSNVDNEEEYVLTQSDIDAETGKDSGIYKSFDDDTFNRSLSDLLGY